MTTKNDSRQSLQKRLVQTMLIFMILLVSLLAGGLFLFRQISIPGKDTADSLRQQKAFFMQNMLDEWNTLSVMGVDLSEEVSRIIDAEIQTGSYTDQDLIGTGQKSTQSEKDLLPVLTEKLLQTDCSGGFVIFNHPESDNVPGIYIRKDIHQIRNPRLSLYRGSSALTSDTDLTLHSKWHMEMNTDTFPDYRKLLKEAEKNTVEECVTVSHVVPLSLTDERVVLLICPVKGNDDVVYGLCGFEISERYFRIAHEQPADLSGLICMIDPYDNATLKTDQVLHCGYHYVQPTGQFMVSDLSNHLQKFTSDNPDHDAYAGIQDDLEIPFANSTMKIAVMVPYENYRDSVANSIRQYLVLACLILFAGGACCWYFSRLYLRPIRKSLAMMKERNYADARVDIHELDDLSDFMQEEKSVYEGKMKQLSEQKESAWKEVSRLAYDRKKEIDPLAYERFVRALKTLTVTEYQILGMVGDGMKTKEIMEKCQISENTLKFHLKNIYSKLDVHSRKQAAMYLNLYRQEKHKKA